MPETFQALAVIAFGLLPGALYVWAFERLVGSWGIGLSDRLLRFIGISAVFHAVVAPISYWIWAEIFLTGKLSSGELSLLMWLVPVSYVGIPIVAGSRVAIAMRKGQAWARFLTGPDPEPWAWDYLFGLRPDGWVLLKLKSGIWLGGAFSHRDARWRSYASGYPEAAEVDPDSGEFHYDANGAP